MSLQWRRPSTLTCGACGKKKAGSLYAASLFGIPMLDTAFPPGWWVGGDGSGDEKAAVFACSEKCADVIHAAAEKKVEGGAGG